MLAIGRILRHAFGDKYPFPRMRAPKLVVWALGPMLGPVTRKFIQLNVGHKVAFDNHRSQALGVQYRPVEQTLTEHFQQALDDGLIRRRG